MQRSMYKVLRHIALGLPIILAGCHPTQTVDEPASNLDLKVAIIDTEPAPSDNKVPVVAQFFLNGNLVQFGNNVSVVCNGIALTFNGLGHAARVPISET